MKKERIMAIVLVLYNSCIIKNTTSRLKQSGVLLLIMLF